MEKILFLLLKSAFVAKPALAESGTASASAHYICPGSDVFLYYTGDIPGSFWELKDPQTGKWKNPASANQTVNFSRLFDVAASQSYVFRVKSPDGENFVFSNEVTIETFGAHSGVLPAVVGVSCQT